MGEVEVEEVWMGDVEVVWLWEVDPPPFSWFDIPACRKKARQIERNVFMILVVDPTRCHQFSPAAVQFSSHLV